MLRKLNEFGTRSHKSWGCNTADCFSVLRCVVPDRRAPARLAEFNLGTEADRYCISVVNGFYISINFVMLIELHVFHFFQLVCFLNNVQCTRKGSV